MTTVAAGDEFRTYVERIEKVLAEKKSSNAEYNEIITDIYTEMKGKGYDVPATKEVIKLRSKDPDELAEFEGVLDVYKSALGM